MSPEEYKKLYLGNWKITEKQKLLYEIGKYYHETCEIYDRAYCTGHFINDSIMPANSYESILINKYAILIKSQLYEKYLQFTKQEIHKAIVDYFKRG